MTKQRTKRRKSTRLRQALGAAAPKGPSVSRGVGASTTLNEPPSPSQEDSVSPLDLGLEDLLAVVGDEQRGAVQIGAEASSAVPSEEAVPEPTPIKSPYIELADAGQWVELVRLCEKEGMKSLLCQVWWIRAHLEAQTMPVSLLQPSYELAKAQQTKGENAVTPDEAEELCTVLWSCHRWFEPSAGSIAEDPVTRGAPSPLEHRNRAAPSQDGHGVSVSQLPNSAESASYGAAADTQHHLAPGQKEPQLHRSIQESSPAPKKRSRLPLIISLIVSGILGVALVLIRLFSQTDEAAELIDSPIPYDPRPQLAPSLRHAELSPLTSLEILQTAMDEVVNKPDTSAKGESAKSLPQPEPPSVASQPQQRREPVRPTPPAAREDIMLDGPMEPRSISELRLRPESDPAASARDRRAESRSVWDRIEPVKTPLAATTPLSSVTDFFHDLDDHPGYPVERYHAPQMCQLAEQAVVRTRPSEFGAVTARLKAGDTVMIDQRIGPWLRLQSKSGLPGFARATCRYEARPEGRPTREEDEWRR